MQNFATMLLNQAITLEKEAALLTRPYAGMLDNRCHLCGLNENDLLRPTEDNKHICDLCHETN